MITLYVLYAIGLLKIAQKRGLSNIAWMGFIPILSDYLVARIAETTTFCKFKKFHTISLVLAIVRVAIAPLCVIPYVGFVFSPINFAVTIGAAVITIICLYRIYQQIIPDNATGMLVLSILVPGASNVITFVIRNRETAGENIDIVQ